MSPRKGPLLRGQVLLPARDDHDLVSGMLTSGHVGIYPTNLIPSSPLPSKTGYVSN